MSKLICYGITHNALMVIQSTRSNLDVPDGWFDWMFPNKDSPSGQAVCRIQILDVQRSDSSLAQWNVVAREAGFDCVLVFSTEDIPAFAHLSPHLDGDVELIPVGVVPNEAESLGRAALLKRLREPESFFQILWNSTREGGLLCIEDLGMSEVPTSHWWAYGNGLRRWIANAKAGGAQEELWQRSCDYSKWNAWKAVGVADVKLDLDLCWNAKAEIGWHWNTSTPCTVTDIPSLGSDGVIAYYPMRQIPCCGIARRQDGSLETIGALPDEKDANGNWVWDNGSIRKAFTNPTSWLLERLKVLKQVLCWNASEPQAALEHKYSASSEQPYKSVSLSFDGEQIDVRYNGLRIEIDPSNRAGPSASKKLWVTAFIDLNHEASAIVEWSCTNQPIDVQFRVDGAVVFTVSELPFPKE